MFVDDGWRARLVYWLMIQLGIDCRIEYRCARRGEPRPAWAPYQWHDGFFTDTDNYVEVRIGLVKRSR